MTDDPLDFTGRVAIVTGAGRGIGRAYAELLAARGAEVVVNDLGVAVSGTGADATPAQQAVDAIAAAGGTCVADTSDVTTTEGAEALVQHALDAFGRLDVVINNAGIFGLDAFPDMEVEELQRQLAVHVGGSFAVTRAAWPHLIAAGSGRIVLTTSTSALGADNTVAYSTAKAAVLGLGRSLAQAGLGVGIKVNLVAPMAMTRMMSTGMGLDGAVPRVPDRDPSLVAPLVALLCHETCPTTGETFVSGMRRVSRLAIVESAGYLHPALHLTPETVRSRWDAVTTLQDAPVVTSTMAWSASNERHLAAAPVSV